MLSKRILDLFKTFPSLVFLLLVLAVFTLPVISEAQTTNFPNGVTNVTRIDLFGNLPQPDRTITVDFFDDFLHPSTGDYINMRAWTGIVTPTAALSLGALEIEADQTENDFEQWRSISTIMLETGKKAWFACRLKSSIVTQADLYAGLSSNVASASTFENSTDGVWFRVDDGDANVDLVVSSGGTATTTTAVGTVTADTYSEFGFYYDGVDKIKIYLDGVLVGSSVTTNLPSVALNVGFSVYNGAATSPDAGPMLDIDYVYAVKER